MTSNHGRYREYRASEAGTPPTRPQVNVNARPGALSRWKLSEPVRLYVYALLVIALGGLTLAGYVTGDWAEYARTAAGVVLGLVPLAEFVRASVYSPAGHISDLWRMGAEVRAGAQVLEAADGLNLGPVRRPR